MSEATRVMRYYRTAERLPLGRTLFTKAFQWVAPYFRSIPVSLVSLEPGRATVTMKDTWRVHNHLGTVHAIALCNLAELAMGATAEATIPATHRWIPKGMEVEYLAKARGRMTANARLDLPDTLEDRQEVIADIPVTDPEGTLVFRARIRLWVTRQKERG